MKWIKASERLPDKGQSVLIYTLKGEMFKGTFYNTETGIWGTQRDDNGEYYSHLDYVSHWAISPNTPDSSHPEQGEQGRIKQLEEGIGKFIQWMKEKRPHVSGLGAPISILESLIEGIEFYWQPKLSSPPPEGQDEELQRLYEWVMDDKRKQAQTFFTAGWLRNVAREIEWRIKELNAENISLRAEVAEDNSIINNNKEVINGALSCVASMLENMTLGNHKEAHNIGLDWIRSLSPEKESSQPLDF